ncbi:hypothetical protein O181_002652 [Austropuccinia psidii MF-1]|uniref:GPI inositol-deacylase n=1 Tax=Austropuccinia psidii MF-1 TaxID=1389203 RepID=A0A9Q3BCW1_9BASI|nr:hypothetical protein [Austropuccinia psidii MF-1]
MMKASKMFNLSKTTALITLTSSFLFIYFIRSFNDTLYSLDLVSFVGPRVSVDGKTCGAAKGKSAGSCRMSWMSPSYIQLQSINSPFNKTYSSYLYREHGWQLNHQPTGSPVLFIPGNAGSSRQVRSFGAAAATLYYQSPSQPHPSFSERLHPGLDFFTIDFNDQLSAFHGQTLIHQAEYANDVIQFILSTYQHSRSLFNPHLPIPSSVLIIGHSMGGLVARQMLMLPNYLNGTINTIISISSPHAIPPIPLERQIEAVYDQINSFWRHSYTFESVNHALEDLLLISISGGTSDTTIASDSSSLLSLAPDSHGLTVFTTTIPGVWSPMDHLAILWCDQLRRVLVKALLEVTDPRLSKQVRSVEDRLSLFESHLIHGHGIEPFQNDNRNLQRFLALSPDPGPYTIHSDYSSLRLTSSNLTQMGSLHTHIIPIPTEHGLNAYREFTLLSTLIVNDRLNLLVCKGTFPTQLLSSCQSVSRNYSSLLPRSQFVLPPARELGPDDQPDPPSVLNYIRVPPSDISNYDFIAIQIFNPSASSTFIVELDSEFLICEFRNLLTSVTTVTSLFFTLCTSGFSLRNFPQSPGLVSELKLPNFSSSLLAFKIILQRGSECNRRGLFAPMMRQHNPILGESKFHPNIHSAVLYTHFSTAYTPFRKMSKKENENRGLLLTFWVDPNACDGQNTNRSMKINLRLDWYESTRKVILRYRTSLIALPTGIIAMVLAIQLHAYQTSRQFIPFGSALSLWVKRYCLKNLCLIGVLQSIQSLVLSMLQSVSHQSDLGFSLVYPSSLVSDLLLGTDHLLFVLLVWLMVFVAIGWTVLMHIVLDVLLRFLIQVWITVRPASPSPHQAYYLGDSSQPVVNRMTGFLIFLGTLTVLFTPYQFTFIVLLIMQLIATLQALESDIRMRALDHNKGANRNVWYHYDYTILLLMICLLPCCLPIVLVWLRNLTGGWYQPFPEGRNVFRIIGFLLWTRWVRQTSMLSKGERFYKKPKYIQFTQRLFNMTGMMMMLYGIRHTYKTFDLK